MSGRKTDVLHIYICCTGLVLISFCVCVGGSGGRNLTKNNIILGLLHRLGSIDLWDERIYGLKGIHVVVGLI